MKHITLKWMEDRRACEDAVIAFKKRFGTKATTKDTLAWLNKINQPGWLVWTMGQDDVGITEELLSHGADIHACGDLALQLAAECGHLSTVKLLFEQGADIHAYNDDALRWAARNGHLDIVKFLFEQGADVHAYDDYALRWAAWNGHLDTVKFLVEHRADIHARNDDALRWAARCGHIETAEFLRQAGR